MAPNEKVVVAKRGCTCCGTGCVISALGVPLTVFATWETLGLVAALVLWPAIILGAHTFRFAANKPKYFYYGRHPRPGAL